jgi:hypothetical protein
MKGKKIFGMLIMMLVFGIMLVGCPTETDESSEFVGYWRTENTYISSGKNYYTIFVFENNRYFRFGIEKDSLAYIKNIPINDAYWRNYTYNKSIITMEYITTENMTIKIDRPYYFDNNSLIITFSQNEAESMGYNNRNIKFIKI